MTREQFGRFSAAVTTALRTREAVDAANEAHRYAEATAGAFRSRDDEHHDAALSVLSYLGESGDSVRRRENVARALGMLDGAIGRTPAARPGEGDAR